MQTSFEVNPSSFEYHQQGDGANLPYVIDTESFTYNPKIDTPTLDLIGSVLIEAYFADPIKDQTKDLDVLTKARNYLECMKSKREAEIEESVRLLLPEVNEIYGVEAQFNAEPPVCKPFDKYYGHVIVAKTKESLKSFIRKTLGSLLGRAVQPDAKKYIKPQRTFDCMWKERLQTELNAVIAQPANDDLTVFNNSLRTYSQNFLHNDQEEDKNFRISIKEQILAGNNPFILIEE